jgi:ankyrin repeat protein
LNPGRIERPYRNLPLEPDQKQSNLERFVTWREARLADQSAKKLVCACETGDLAVATAILDERPELVEHRTPEGWTPLIVAAFNQHPHLIAHLVELGANPNVAGRNGTTPLMYAKTALLHDETADYKSLEILLESGGDPRLRDSYGHDIFHYVNVAGDVRMLEWLKKRTGVR